MRRKRRVRELAGDDRAGLFARRKYRAAYRQYLRKAWPYLTVGGLAAFGATAVVAVLIHGGFERGVVVGFGAAASVAALAQWVVLASGIGPTYMGETAERWTAGELRRLQRSGWWLINHFNLDYGDLDHLLIGPAGVFVIETKWSAFGWKERYADNRVASAIRQVGEGCSRDRADP